MSTTKNFLGIPVQGEIYPTTPAKKQRPVEELAPYLEAVLEEKTVEAIRWRQYTPYFNDGDVCEFSIYEVTFKMAGLDETGGDYEDGFYNSYSSEIKGGYREDYNRETRRWDKVGEALPPHPALDALNALSGVISDGTFYDVLKGAFGDHAVVTVTREGITVDTYDHD